MNLPDRKSPAAWDKTSVPPGSRKRIRLEVGESYTGITIHLPIMVWRAKQEGPTVFLSAAVHGDEINGTGTLRELMNDPDFSLQRGTLLLLPVINVMGFERHSRYMPDRRDLNRAFPGSNSGSLTSRLAHLLLTEIIQRCHYGIDLHTAAVRRTNYPNVRADMDHPACRDLAEAFGCDIIVDNPGPQGSLRRSATHNGCPTIVLEAGEVWKVEPLYIETALRGIRNCLAHLGMTDSPPSPPPRKPWIVDSTRWVRVDAGGFLQFHVSLGEFVSKNQLIATNTGLLGREQEHIHSPHNGVVIGMTTMPAVSPGDPVVQIALFSPKDLRRYEKEFNHANPQSPENRLRQDLATNLHVVDPDPST